MNMRNKLRDALTAIGDVLALIPEETWDAMSATGMPERLRKILDDTNELEDRLVIHSGPDETIVIRSIKQEGSRKVDGMRVRSGNCEIKCVWDPTLRFTMENAGTMEVLRTISNMCEELAMKVHKRVVDPREAEDL